MAEHIYKTCIENKGKASFYCPHGHGQHYTEGESDLDKMRRERDRYAQQVHQKDDEIKDKELQLEQVNRRLAAQKGKVTKLKNRAAAGVCPCCNRSFQNLKNHMASQHPTFTKEEAA